MRSHHLVAARVESPGVGWSRAREICRLGGNAQRTRHMFSKAFVEALLEDFREWGPQAIARVRTETPAAYLRVSAMLVPKELKLEHSQAIKALSDEELEAAIAVLEPMVAAHMQRAAKSLPALPAPDVA